jgi:hypothetical protein
MADELDSDKLQESLVILSKNPKEKSASRLMFPIAMLCDKLFLLAVSNIIRRRITRELRASGPAWKEAQRFTSFFDSSASFAHTYNSLFLS